MSISIETLPQVARAFDEIENERLSQSPEPETSFVPSPDKS